MPGGSAAPSKPAAGGGARGDGACEALPATASARPGDRSDDREQRTRQEDGGERRGGRIWVRGRILLRVGHASRSQCSSAGAILCEVHESRPWFRSFEMSPSGAELLRQVKSQIDEVDPSEVNELIDEGVAIVDVRGQRRVRHRPSPRRQARSPRPPRAAHRERRRPIATRRADPLLPVRQPLGLRARARCRRISATSTCAR